MSEQERQQARRAMRRVIAAERKRARKRLERTREVAPRIRGYL